MGSLVDISGERIGRLIVLNKGPNKQNKAKDVQWECRCDCGSLVLKTATNLRFGQTRSCGCLKVDTCIKRSTKHGLRQTKVARRIRLMWPTEQILTLSVRPGLSLKRRMSL